MASCIIYKEEPLAGWMSSRLVSLIFYDDRARAHILLTAETSAPFQKSSPEFLSDCETLAHTLAAKLGLRCYVEKY